MCGIYCCAHAVTCTDAAASSGQQQLLENRGPDRFGKTCVHCDQVDIQLCASVLHMRGASVVGQPLIQNGDVLCFNGEIYDDVQVNLSDSGLNDSKLLMNALQECTREMEIVHVFSKLKGPHAYVFYQKSTQSLFFGRDVFGRRSLLIGKNDQKFVLSSVNCGHEFPLIDVPVGAIFVSKFELNKANDLEVTLSCHLLMEPFENSLQNVCTLFGNVNVMQLSSLEVPDYAQINRETCDIAYSLDDAIEEILISQKSHVKQWLAYVHRSVKTRLVGVQNSVPVIGVLFSGGVDSLLLAAVAHLNLPNHYHIHLVNVAFSRINDFEVPDRQTGMAAFENLKKLYPLRVFRFIESNVTLEELREWREKRIRYLLHPQNTVLDDSIACTLWFAAKAARDSGSGRILLVGTGADELLGGYSRHRVKFIAGAEDAGRLAIIGELEMEIRRIAYRNMGRDDRAISDNAIESRLPYLDEDLVLYTNSLPLEVKCNMNLPRGKGEKLVLRLALKYLGFDEQIVLTPKRAMQFGSRIAKLEANKCKGQDLICNSRTDPQTTVHI